MSDHIDPRHSNNRNVLRIVGPMIAIVGLLFTIVGIGSFFAAFGSFGTPRYFWCAFIGLPMLGVGLSITKFAYLGSISRYMANEVAPVGKDVVNYMADGTQDAMRGMATAVGEGLRAGSNQEKQQILRCHKCNADNETPANFCKSCGAALSKTRACATCGERNDPDARFCDNCGKGMTAS